MDVQGCCLPARKNSPKPSPAAPNSGRGRPFLQLQQVSWGPGSVLLRMFKAAVCQPAKLAKRSPAAPRRHSGRGTPRAPTQAAADLSCSSNKSLRPWQCPFKDVQGCRLPARKNSPKPSPAAPRRHSGRGTPRRHSGRGRPFPAAPTSPLRPWQCPFKDVQGCRLPARKTRQTLPCSSQAPLRPRHSQAPLRPRQTFPAAPTSPWGPGSVLLRTFKAAVCQPAKLAKPSPAAPRRHSGRGTPRRHSGRGRPFLQLQQVPEDLAVSLFKDVQGCRLPARKTRQTLPCSSQAPLSRGRPFLQLQQVPA